MASNTVERFSYAPPSTCTRWVRVGAADVRGRPVVVRRPSVLGLRLRRSFVLSSADEFQQPDSLSADLEQ